MQEAAERLIHLLNTCESFNRGRSKQSKTSLLAGRAALLSKAILQTSIPLQLFFYLPMSSRSDGPTTAAAAALQAWERQEQ
jgi:hypothetical protein